MSLNAFPLRTNIPEGFLWFARILGVNGANPTTQIGGEGATITRVSEGLYRVDFAENPGTFLGGYFGYGAATPADLRGYNAVRDTWDATEFRFDFSVYPSDGGAIGDIIANQYLDIFIYFRKSGVTG